MREVLKNNCTCNEREVWKRLKDNLPTSEAGINMLAVLYALSEDIKDLYSLNVSTGIVTVYRTSGIPEGIYDLVKEDLEYEKQMEAYISNNVYVEDQALIRDFVKLENIRAQVAVKSPSLFHYRVFRDNKIDYYYLKCVKVENEGEISDIIFAFASEEDDISKKCLIGQIELDELTGLYTRQAFFHHARQIIDENPYAEYDMLMADVENFKMINSIYGEAVGDEVIKYIANFFYENTSTGICGRYGGDEFIALTKATSKRDKDWLNRTIEELCQNAPVPNLEIKCGVYTNIDRSLSVSAMCDRTHLAVKSIKHNFETFYASYDGPVSKKHMQSQMFEAKFKTAITNGEFIVWYQPKFDTNTEQIVGAEALVRWQLENGEFVSPGEFIPTFEEDGLVVKLDEFVFRSVCRCIRYWLDNGFKVCPISVNLSRASLYREGTVKKYKKIIEEVGISPEYVPIELTETATVKNAQLENLMNELKEAGFQLHMDDFGTGESSLASFNALPFDVIKLDKTLIDFIGDNGGDELLKHTIELAHFKNIKVVAEGVEDKKQVEFLKKLGCDMIQGFYYSRPKPQIEIEEYFES